MMCKTYVVYGILTCKIQIQDVKRFKIITQLAHIHQVKGCAVLTSLLT